jgi:hypothetical protein
MCHYDTLIIARDLIIYEKNSSGKVNGIPENLEPSVLDANTKFILWIIYLS